MNVVKPEKKFFRILAHTSPHLSKLKPPWQTQMEKVHLRLAHKEVEFAAQTTTREGNT